MAVVRWWGLILYSNRKEGTVLRNKSLCFASRLISIFPLPHLPISALFVWQPAAGGCASSPRTFIKEHLTSFSSEWLWYVIQTNEQAEEKMIDRDNESSNVALTAIKTLHFMGYFECYCLWFICKGIYIKFKINRGIFGEKRL